VGSSTQVYIVVLVSSSVHSVHCAPSLPSQETPMEMPSGGVHLLATTLVPIAKPIVIIIAASILFMALFEILPFYAFLNMRTWRFVAKSENSIWNIVRTA